MKVFTVSFGVDYDDAALVCICSTMELAVKFAELEMKSHPPIGRKDRWKRSTETHWRSGSRYIEIEEVEVHCELPRPSSANSERE